MKTLVKVLNVIGAIVSSLLMPALLCALIACPIANALSSLTRPEAMTDMIGKIDMGDLTSADPAIESMIDQLGIPADAIEDLLDLEIVEDFAKMYLEDAEAQLFDGQNGSSITEKKLLAMLDDNMSEVIGFIRKYSPDGVKDMSDAEIAEELHGIAQEKAPDLIEALPPVSDIMDEVSDLGVDTEFLTRTYDFVKNSLMPLIYTLIIVLSLLIFGCRAYHLEGTIWLGIDYLLAAAALFAVSVLSDVILSVIAFADFGSSLSGILSNTVEPFAGAYLLSGVAFVGAFIAVRIILSNKRKKSVAAQNEQAYRHYQLTLEGAQTQNADPYSVQDQQYNGSSDNNGTQNG